MSPVSLALIGIGVVLIVIGVFRARGPWSRYQGLRAQEANIARYESWRGGVRDTGPTGASVAMDVLRGQVRNAALVAGAGAAAVVAGLLLG